MSLYKYSFLNSEAGRKRLASMRIVQATHLTSLYTLLRLTPADSSVDVYQHCKVDSR